MAVGHPVAAGEVRGPDAGAEAEAVVVGHRVRRPASVSNGTTTATGPKISSWATRMLVGCVGQHGGLQEEAVRSGLGQFGNAAAGGEPGAFVETDGDVARCTLSR